MKTLIVVALLIIPSICSAFCFQPFLRSCDYRDQYCQSDNQRMLNDYRICKTNEAIQKQTEEINRQLRDMR